MKQDLRGDETMFELVPSIYMREYFKEKGFEFTDFQKATLIWNMPGKTRDEIFAALKELADTAKDEVTRQQILERIQFEEKQFAVFMDNSADKYVYVVEDYEEAYSYGFFAEYEMALNYAINYSRENDVTCSIKKQLIVRSEEDKKVRNPVRVNPNFFPEPEEEFCDYDGSAVACVDLDRHGNVCSLWSYELSKEEEQKVDAFRKDRFEYQFIKIPFDMEKGLPVKNVLDGTYGILGQGKEEWDEYMQRIEDRNLYVDFSDIQVIVYRLTESGYWTHMHISPMYLEIDFPPAKLNDEKWHAMRGAMEALGDYFHYKNRRNDYDASLVIKYARAYAEVCKEQNNGVKPLDDAKTVEDILC